MAASASRRSEDSNEYKLARLESGPRGRARKRDREKRRRRKKKKKHQLGKESDCCEALSAAIESVTSAISSSPPTLRYERLVPGSFLGASALAVQFLRCLLKNLHSNGRSFLSLSLSLLSFFFFFQGERLPVHFSLSFFYVVVTFADPFRF